MKKEEIVELLRKDMRGEHQAIIQYLYHAYAMGEGEIACEVEAIARDEMRHLDWLADAIMELGGEPTMERDEPDFSLGTVAENLQKNAELEQVAVEQYRAHIEAIDDPKIRRLLARILHDELAHKEQFLDLAKEAAEEAEAAAEGEGAVPAAPPERLVEILNQGIRHEYTVILQYLYHSFVAEDKELFEELQNTAINEMQHMGWLAEALASRGGKPEMSHTELFLSHDAQENLQADIAVEQEVTRDYTEQLGELDDEKLKKLIARIRDHEIYHDAVFKYLLEEVREEAKPGEEAPQEEKPQAEEPEEKGPPTIPTVGSLKE